MASQLALPLIFLTLFSTFSFIQAQTPTVPAPVQAGSVNITDILEKAGSYSNFIRLLQQTGAADQINNQANNSRDGMTIFAPTDNAFQTLPPGALNQLSNQQQVELIQYHIIPRFYDFKSLQTVSNPVRTQASGQDGKQFGLFFTGQANNQNQVNISTGIVNTTVFNALSQVFPLAVYEVDKVLLPAEFYQKATAPSPSPLALTTPKGGSVAGKTTPVEAPSFSSPSGSAKIVVRMMSLASGLWVFSIYLLCY